MHVKRLTPPRENPLNVSQDFPELGVRLHLPSALGCDFRNFALVFVLFGFIHTFFVLSVLGWVLPGLVVHGVDFTPQPWFTRR